jgi:hypothetical protein
MELGIRARRRNRWILDSEKEPDSANGGSKKESEGDEMERVREMAARRLSFHRVESVLGGSLMSVKRARF